jgi:putative Holliday junction resolvase
MRAMGLDIGDKTIGVDVSDPFGWTAQGIKTIKRANIKSDIIEIELLIKEYGVDRIVAGLPKNMNNTLGPRSEKVMYFCDKLRETLNIDIIYQDERLTTVSAERILIDADVSRSKRKKVIDTIAATYILQSYLDRLANKG